jgi:alpha-L-rhamnosidase
MKTFVDWIHRANPKLWWRNGRGNNYGDWLHGGTFINPPDGYSKKNSEIPKDVFSTAYFYYSATLLAKSAKILGKTDDYNKYNKLAEDIKKIFISMYVSEEGIVRGETQGGYAMVLQLGLFPEERRSQIIANLVKALNAKEDRISTGFHSTIWMMKQLSENGQNELAYKLLLSHRFPSWFYSMDQGATTVWERWDGFVKGRGFQDKSMNSFNHFSIGAVSEWMYRTILGIRLDEENPAWRHFYVKPQPGGGLTWAKGSYNAITGKIEVSWKIENDKFSLEVLVPPNTTATIVTPFDNKEHKVASGRHVFESGK